MINKSCANSKIESQRIASAVLFLFAWFKVGDAKVDSYAHTAAITCKNDVSLGGVVVEINWGTPAAINLTDSSGVTKVFNNDGSVVTPVSQPANNTKYSMLAPSFKLYPSNDGSKDYGQEGYAGAEITGNAAKQYAGTYDVQYTVTGAAKISSTNPDSTAGGAFESTDVFTGTSINATLTISSSDGTVSISPATIYYSITGSDSNFANPGNEAGTVAIQAR